MAKRNLSGGGIQSNQLREVPVRVGKAREGINVVAVSRLGAMQGNHVTERGRTLPNASGPLVSKQRPISIPQGNQVALNVGKGGPGTGRNLYRTGTQCMYGKPVQGSPNTARRDILSEFGPERRRG
jgi:hypothetical protein